jgi:hypothetical protein
MLIGYEKDADRWYDFALVALKFNMQPKAEQYLFKVMSLKGVSKELHLLMASIML